MSTEVIMISCIIDGMEVQEVATANIPGAFLQTDYDKGDINIKSGYMISGLSNLRNPNTSVTNIGEGVWHI